VAGHAGLLGRRRGARRVQVEGVHRIAVLGQQARHVGAQTAEADDPDVLAHRRYSSLIN
jgi:hypothetical protein